MVHLLKEVVTVLVEAKLVRHPHIVNFLIVCHFKRSHQVEVGGVLRLKVKAECFVEPK